MLQTTILHPTSFVRSRAIPTPLPIDPRGPNRPVARWIVIRAVCVRNVQGIDVPSRIATAVTIFSVTPVVPRPTRSRRLGVEVTAAPDKIFSSRRSPALSRRTQVPKGPKPVQSRIPDHRVLLVVRLGNGLGS